MPRSAVRTSSHGHLDLLVVFAPLNAAPLVAARRVLPRKKMCAAMKTETTFDAVIIGGGPAGSAAAAVLAEHGRKALLLEREKFPRYHIGESLLPFTFQPLQRLGLIDKMRQSAFVKKYSVQFVSPSGKASQPFYFYTRYDRDTVAQTWQVLRAEFDMMLLNNAREKGATVKEETAVQELVKD